MTQLDSQAATAGAEPADALGEYRPFSRLAIAGLVIGAASALALVHTLLWVLPALGAVVSLAGMLANAASEENLAGRRAAVWGLSLSLLWGAMAVGGTVAYQVIIRREARALADVWFELLRTNQPHKAHQLTLLEPKRQPPRDPLWNHYRTSSMAHSALTMFVDEPLVRSVLALGEKATIRYWGTEEVLSQSGRQYVTLLYTVTYEEAGERKTFFARITLRRAVDPWIHEVEWNVENYEGGARPHVRTKK